MHEIIIELIWYAVNIVEKKKKKILSLQYKGAFEITIL
jgi:hypothetical protein